MQKKTKKNVKNVKKVKKSLCKCDDKCCSSKKINKQASKLVLPIPEFDDEDNAEVVDDKGIVDVYKSIVEKINDIIDGYGKIRDIIHVVRELSGDDEVVELVRKISSNKDPEMYILLAAAILRVIKQEMEDNDGIFDYTPEDA